MGLLSIFKKAKGPDFSLFNEGSYKISKDEDTGAINVYSGDSKVAMFGPDYVVVLNENLAYKDFVKYDRSDRIPVMSDATIVEADAIVYIKCGMWTPNNVSQFPDRIMCTGTFSTDKLVVPIGVFVRLVGNYVDVISVNGEFKDIPVNKVLWSGHGYPDSDSWRFAKIRLIDIDMYEIETLSRAPGDVDVIINGTNSSC